MAARTKKTSSESAEVTAKNNQGSTRMQNTTPVNGQNEKQSQLATILVGLLIIASGLLIYNYFQRTNAPETTSRTEQEQTDSNNQANSGDNDTSEDEDNNSDDDSAQPKEGEYTVVEGDSLWSIAEKVYGDGFSWTKIRDANKLPTNNYGQHFVEVGQVLNIPDSAAVAEKPSDDKDVVASANDSSVAGEYELRETPATAIETYTVQHGDTLWSIAEKVYGDGHKWELIFNDTHNQLGQLSNGSPLVHAGNVLYIPPVL